MKHIKSIEDFKMVNEQLFGNVYGKLVNMLGLDGELKPPGDSVVNGEVKVNISGDKGKNIQTLIDTMKKHGITNPYTQIAILGVIGKETEYIPKNEIGYGSTSNDRIRKIFGSRVSGLSNADLDTLKRNDVNFFDRIYGSTDPTGAGQKYGNTTPGDGYKYRGRGFNGITFKSIYQGMQKLLDKNSKLDKSVNIVTNPESLNELDVAAEVAILYFLDRASNKIMAQKYGTQNINGFKDQSTANKAMAHANAGWGNNIEGSDALANTEKYAANFTVDSSGTASMA
jgi:putative chitinase